MKNETNGETVTVANRVSREELEKTIEGQSPEPLGSLPIRLEQYTELLPWLAGDKSPAEKDGRVEERWIPSRLLRSVRWQLQFETSDP